MKSFAIGLTCDKVPSKDHRDAIVQVEFSKGKMTKADSRQLIKELASVVTEHIYVWVGKHGDDRLKEILIKH